LVVGQLLGGGWKSILTPIPTSPRELATLSRAGFSYAPQHRCEPD
jgi:hypothetical protein